MNGDMQNRLRNYLANGGLFNPELMDGPTVRDLLVAFGEAYVAQAAELEKLRRALAKVAELVGATANPDCSIEFLCLIPTEVELALAAKAAKHAARFERLMRTRDELLGLAARLEGL